MEICLDCDITDKLMYCCSSNPETGQVASLTLGNGLKVNACPSLDAQGECLDYSNASKPSACGDYECPKLYELDLVQLRELRSSSSEW
tara:strand:- start:431 stop:694 length:264 start_codon:yes stop_codon:yes gene_type:complete